MRTLKLLYCFSQVVLTGVRELPDNVDFNAIYQLCSIILELMFCILQWTVPSYVLSICGFCKKISHLEENDVGVEELVRCSSWNS